MVRRGKKQVRKKHMKQETDSIREYETCQGPREHCWPSQAQTRRTLAWVTSLPVWIFSLCQRSIDMTLDPLASNNKWGYTRSVPSSHKAFCPFPSTEKLDKDTMSLSIAEELPANARAHNGNVDSQKISLLSQITLLDLQMFLCTSLAEQVKEQNI